MALPAPMQQASIAQPPNLSSDTSRHVEFADAGAEFKTIPWDALTDSLVADWIDIRAKHSQYRSPFWSHEFIGHVDAIRPGVEVAIAKRNGRAVAILPFRRVSQKDARPVGAGINDAHGQLAAPSIDFTFDEFLSRCGLRSFAFHAAPPNSPGIAQYEIGRTRAFLADLTVDPKGYEHFLRARNRTIDKQGQKTRKLGREVGKLRFEYDCADNASIRRLLTLKSEQYRRTHTFDILSVPWIQELIHRLHKVDRNGPSEIRGMLSVLFAGEIPVALHFGMEEGDLLHYWFPVFDSKYHFGSPGTQLFLDVANEATSRGIRAIDMGYGEQAYKHKLTNVITEMSYGLVDRNYIRRTVHRTNLAVGAKLKEFKIRERVKPIARKIMPSFGAGTYNE